MDDSIKSGLTQLHDKFKSLWIVVLIGMVLLIVIAYILHHFQILDNEPLVNPLDADKISLVLIVLIVLAMFFIKRSYLVMSKIIEKSKKYSANLNNAEFTFLSAANEKHAQFASAVLYINKLYLRIWFMADLIVIIAFVNFILAPFINTFLIYSFVGLYSIISNYPSIKLYQKLFTYINS